jgi:serine-type D-Ala-D-Ala carboxypeptidase/endopeptidase (penicillin-binding protein 4)
VIFVRPIALLLLVAVPALASDVRGDLITAVTQRAAIRHAAWGIVVEDAGGTILFERNADTLMIPASVRKLFTASTVLACHGADGTLDTWVGITGVQDGRTLRGDLVIRGTGDPSVGGRWEQGSARNARLQRIVDALGRLGIDRIDGDLVIDSSAFDDRPIRGSWKADNLGKSYAPPVDALAYNENVIGVRVDGRAPARAIVTLDPSFAEYAMESRCSRPRHTVGVALGNVVTIRCARDGKGTLSYLVAVDDPAQFVASAVKSFLGSRGVAVEGTRVERSRVIGARPIVVVPSPPIVTLLGAILEDSANLYSEMLLKSISSGSHPGSWDSSLELERAYLETTVGIDQDEFSFDDGSGLSHANAVTPRATVRLLRFLEADPARFHVVTQTTATPGNGTLRRRLVGLEGRVVAKTGTLDGVAAIAGWAYGEEGERRRFAIFVNHHTTSGKTASDAIDDIVRIVADF